MADSLGLDPTYLSQLENAHRNVDDFYLSRATQLVRDFEKANKVKDHSLQEEGEAYGISMVDRIRDYTNRVIHEYGTDPDRLAWIYVEMTRHFPLPAPKRQVPLSSESLSESAGQFSAAAERALELEHQSHSRSPGAGAPSERKHEPSHGAAPESKGRQSPPARVPKQHKV